MLIVTLVISMALLIVSCFHVYNKWFHGNDSHIEVDDQRCMVCLDEVSNGEKLRRLPMCGHWFHAHCIDAWLEVGTTCPLCRVNVVPERNVVISCLVGLGERVGKWVENPLSSELTLAFCETFGLQ